MFYCNVPGIHSADFFHCNYALQFLLYCFLLVNPMLLKQQCLKFCIVLYIFLSEINSYKTMKETKVKTHSLRATCLCFHTMHLWFITETVRRMHVLLSFWILFLESFTSNPKTLSNSCLWSSWRHSALVAWVTTSVSTSGFPSLQSLISQTISKLLS